MVSLWKSDFRVCIFGALFMFYQCDWMCFCAFLRHMVPKRALINRLLLLRSIYVISESSFCLPLPGFIMLFFIRFIVVFAGAQSLYLCILKYLVYIVFWFDPNFIW